MPEPHPPINLEELRAQLNQLRERAYFACQAAQQLREETLDLLAVSRRIAARVHGQWEAAVDEGTHRPRAPPAKGKK